MNTAEDPCGRIDQPLQSVSFDRLACLLRHWTWAAEAMATMDRGIAGALGGAAIRQERRQRAIDLLNQ